MMKRTCVVACMVVTVCLFACSGCSRTTGKNLEANPEFQKVKASLEESQRQRGLLEKDVKKLEGSLTEAESKLADTTKAKNGLQTQVQELTTSRANLEAKVDELGKARVNLDARVNDLTKSRDDLQKTVGSLLDTRGVLEKQVASLSDNRKLLEKQVASLLDNRGVLEKQVAGLTKAKNAALEDARSAQTKVDLLNDRLKAQTQQMMDLQEQMKAIRSVLQQLQQKLE